MMDIATASSAILASVNNELQNAIGGLPGSAYLVSGAIAWDNCSESKCGMLALGPARYYLSDNFPVEAVSSDICSEGAILIADMLMPIIRCAPQPQGLDTAPSPKAMTNSALIVMDDAFHVMCGALEILRTLFTNNDIVGYNIRQQVFVGPEGACVGSELQFSIGVTW
jgi:hypothetical protein